MHNKKTVLLVLSVAIALSVAATSPVVAQPKPGYLPSSTHIFPAGGRRGSTVRVHVGAECTPPGTNFLMTGDGVQAANVLEQRSSIHGEPSPRRKPTTIPITYPKEWLSEVRIAADAPLGPAYWRLSCAQGGTGSRPFLIGDLPELIETESNSTAEQAQRVSLPVTLNGQIHGERDVDYYRFSLKAGDVVVCDVMAGRLGSRLDPIVELLDSAGRKIDVETVHVGSDPVLAHRAKSSGDVLLRIANVTEKGDPAHVYRINVSTQPYVRFAFPAGGRAGTEREIQFFALSGTAEPRVIEQRVKFPAVSNAEFHYRNAALASNAVSLAVDAVQNLVETEPNDALKQAMALSISSTVDGRFGTKTDVDWYQFRAAKGEKLSITCRAFPAGTAALPTLMLTDEQQKPLENAMSVNSQDGVCRIEWTAPATGLYRLRVRDQQHGARGGADFIYRLSLRPARPDFSVALASDVLNVVQGSKTPVEVSLKRIGGFDGPVELIFDGLPSGVTVENATIPAKKNSVKAMLTAKEDVPSGHATFRITARAKIDGETVERIVQSRHLGVDSEGLSIGSSNRDRVGLTICHKPAFRLFCFEAYLYAHRGSVFPYPMQVERLNGFEGPITLQIGDRQNRDLDGVQMFEVVIPPGKSEFTLPIYLPETMHINVQSQSQLYSQGWARFVDKQGQQQSVLVLSEKRNMLRTLPTVVKLKAVDPEFNVKAGSAITCRLRLERTTNFPGPMTLELLDPKPETGFAAKPVQIAAGQTDVGIPVSVTAQLPSGNRQTLTFRATGMLNEKIVIITEAKVLLRFE